MFLGCPKCKYFTNKMADYRRHQFFHHVEERKRTCYREMRNNKCEQSNHDEYQTESVSAGIEKKND